MLLPLGRNKAGELDKPSKDNLKRVAEYLKKNPNKKIGLIGHTDTRGSDALNMTLSKRRAKAVYDMLVKLGVNRKQIIQVEGKGKKEPIYPNETEEYQFRENRRVELIFL
ncbi:OmpA family protein [Bacteroidetes/Chlorobi group bacterium MS-B_bin-24]|nr:MAG: OmpA family protein [Bacteroidetes/Chlorobi group bacterium MS-B_bin-24]